MRGVPDDEHPWFVGFHEVHPDPHLPRHSVPTDSETLGSETRGSETRGAKTRGSEMRGSGTRGSGTSGSEIRGSETKGPEPANGSTRRDAGIRLTPKVKGVRAYIALHDAAGRRGLTAELLRVHDTLLAAFATWRRVKTLQVNVAHTGQSRPDSGLGCQVLVLESIETVPFLLGPMVRDMESNVTFAAFTTRSFQGQTRRSNLGALAAD